MTLNVLNTQAVSTNQAGILGNAPSSFLSFSPDGSKILFYSTANNLITSDTNGMGDVFIKDLLTGEVTLISVSASGIQGNSTSANASFSPNGTKIVFNSDADNLVLGDINGERDVFVKDLITGSITLASTDSLGNQGNADVHDAPIFSPDGSKIAFVGESTNLVSGDTNNALDIFIKDFNTGLTTRVSTNEFGEQTEKGGIYSLSFSPDGSSLLFLSGKNDFAAEGTGGQIIIKNLITEDVTIVSSSVLGVNSNDSNYDPSFSLDGSKVAFRGHGDNLITSDTNETWDVFIKDLVTGEVTLVSVNASGIQGNKESAGSAFSPDGERVAFMSYANNLALVDTDYSLDGFIKDLVTGEILRIGGGYINKNSFSPDGAKIAYWNGENIYIATLNITPGIYGTGLADTLNGTDTDNIIYGFQGADTLYGGLGNDFVRGGADNDLIHGDGGDDKLRGDDGIDTIYGDTGNDDVRGGTGNDSIFGGTDNDQLKGNEGNDTIYGDDGNDELYGESGSDDLYGGAGNDKLSGGDDVDRLNGGDGADKLYGGIGNDQLKGDAGNDSLSGDDGNDKLWGSFGDDTLNGGNGTDELYGDDGNDKLYGGAGADKLSGGNGNDKLTGGEGGDNLWGGTGSDQFVFDAASLSARDTVKDFSMAQGDKLELNNILTGYDPLTSAISDFVKVTESSGKSYLSVDTNGSADGALFIQIAQIDNTVGITNVGQLLTDHVLIVTNSIVV